MLDVPVPQPYEDDDDDDVVILMEVMPPSPAHPFPNPAKSEPVTGV